MLCVWESANDAYGGPGADEVYWCCTVFDSRVAEEVAEDVEYIMTVICQGKGMDDGVEVNDCQHDC